MGFITHNGKKFNTDKKGDGEIHQRDEIAGKFDEREKELDRKQAEKKMQSAQKTKELVNKITELAMKEHRKDMLESPKGARPERMREDPTTPLIREVPFGPDTRAIENLEHGNPKNFDHISHFNAISHQKGFNEFEAEQDKLPKDKQFPTFGDITGQGKKMMMDTTKGHEVDANSFRVIPHGGISIPKEQERIVRTLTGRNWEEGKLKSRAKRTHQSDKDAEEIALDIMFDEGHNKLVNRETMKIRPPKPVRSDFASIISAKKGFKGIVKKETIFRVAENDKPEYVEVKPLNVLKGGKVVKK